MLGLLHRIGIGGALIALATATGGACAAQPTLVAEQSGVVDGDGLIIGPVPVRLHGIDAPEMAQTCVAAVGGAWPCGAAAADALAALVEGRTVECQPLDRDDYGRAIASCAADGADLAAALVDAGLAWAFVRYSTDYVEREAVARRRRVGVWQTAAQPPWEYREERWGRASSSAPGSCPK
jgi:endonuclease YncB( thermonuclease family)